MGAEIEEWDESDSQDFEVFVMWFNVTVDNYLEMRIDLLERGDKKCDR